MSDWPFEPPVTPMEARVRDDLPTGAWAYEPKWDGFRAIAWSAPIRLDSRNHKPLLRYFPELIPSLEALPVGTVVDGEVVVVTGDRLDFDGLQNRLHPAASRVKLLAVETPAQLVAFDLLDGPYFEEKREMVKGKHRRTVDCVVGGYRVHKDGDGIGSILLGLYDGPELHFIGHCSGFPDHDRKELLVRFEEIRAKLARQELEEFQPLGQSFQAAAL